MRVLLSGRAYLPIPRTTRGPRPGRRRGRPDVCDCCCSASPAVSPCAEGAVRRPTLGAASWLRANLQAFDPLHVGLAYADGQHDDDRRRLAVDGCAGARTGPSNRAASTAIGAAGLSAGPRPTRRLHG